MRVSEGKGKEWERGEGNVRGEGKGKGGEGKRHCTYYVFCDFGHSVTQLYVITNASVLM